MTTSRVIRGTRAKISLYICGILVITGLIACYNSTLSQLEDVRKSSDNCHQHQENLSTQLQVISEYKQRLENSLKTEKAEHQQTKTNLEGKLNEDKVKFDKYQRDNKLKLNSLQQHFNLLQTEYDDFKEECSKNQRKQHEEINTLEAKVKEVREELKKVRSSKENLKSQYLQVQMEKENLENKIKEEEGNDKDQESNVNHLTKERNELQREIERLKSSCKPPDSIPQDQMERQVSQKPSRSSILQLPFADGGQQQQRVLDRPDDDNNADKLSSSTSTAKPEARRLGNVRPLLVPTVTPETPPKLPEGVVAVPPDKEAAPVPVNNRYRNVEESAKGLNNFKPVKDIEKENGAHEEFDGPAAQNGLEKKHIDHLAQVQEKKAAYDQDQDYRELHDVQLEENEEDDDVDGYEDHIGRQKDPAVRN